MQNLDYGASFACCSGPRITADGMMIGPALAKSCVQQAPYPADERSIEGCLFKNRVAIPDPRIRKQGLLFTASAAPGLTVAEHAAFKTKLVAAGLAYVAELCGEATFNDKVMPSVGRSMRKLMFSVFTTAPAAQLVPPTVFAIVEHLVDGKQLEVEEEKALSMCTPVLAAAFTEHRLLAATWEDDTPAANFRSLLELLLGVARRTFDAPVNGSAPDSVGEAAAPVGGLDEDGEGAGAVAQRVPDDEELLRMGEFFGNNHGIVRQLRRYTQDSSKEAATGDQACVKFHYDAKRRSPGEAAPPLAEMRCGVCVVCGYSRCCECSQAPILSGARNTACAWASR